MNIGRREFITLIGGAAVAWPLAASAQQRSMPVVGFLAAGANGPNRWGPAFPRGLKEAGYVEGQNVAIDYRGWAPEGFDRFDRLNDLVTEFVRRQVTVILTSNDVPTIAAKRATSTIPIVFFNIFSDPEKLGLVASIARPGGNVTGVGHGQASKIVSLAAEFKIPIMYSNRGFVLQGGLMSYNEDPAEKIQIAANMVGQVLNGARPADLPVRRPSKFEFVINLKSAKELGLTVPPSLLVLADRVIE